MPAETRDQRSLAQQTKDFIADAFGPEVAADPFPSPSREAAPEQYRPGFAPGYYGAFSADTTEQAEALRVLPEEVTAEAQVKYALITPSDSELLSRYMVNTREMWNAIAEKPGDEGAVLWLKRADDGANVYAVQGRYLDVFKAALTFDPERVDADETESWLADKIRENIDTRVSRNYRANIIEAYFAHLKGKGYTLMQLSPVSDRACDQIDLNNLLAAYLDLDKVPDELDEEKKMLRQLVAQLEEKRQQLSDEVIDVRGLWGAAENSYQDTFKELQEERASKGRVLAEVLAWTRTQPTELGLYRIKPSGKASQLCHVSQGQWEKAQNPEWLYVSRDGNAKPMQDHEMIGAWWYGPLPNPPAS